MPSINCTKCQCEVPEGAKFCQKCGNKLVIDNASGKESQGGEYSKGKSGVEKTVKAKPRKMSEGLIAFIGIAIGTAIVLVVFMYKYGYFTNIFDKFDRYTTVDEVHSVLGTPSTTRDSVVYYDYMESYQDVWFKGIKGSKLDVYYRDGKFAICEWFIWIESKAQYRNSVKRVINCLNKVADKDPLSDVWKNAFGRYDLIYNTDMIEIRYVPH